MTAPHRRVCVIEDDHAVRESLAMLLSTKGITAECYISAEEFLTHPLENLGCILVDLRLPGMNGADLVQKIDEEGLKTPCIVMSGNGDRETMSRVSHLDFVCFLPKPCPPQDFLSAVLGALTDQ